MTELANPLSHKAMALLVECTHAFRSQAIAGLIRGVISAIRRRFPPRGAVSAKPSVSIAGLKA